MEQQQQEFQKEGEKKEIEEGEKEYRSCIIQQDGEKRGFDNSLQGDDFITVDQCQTIREMEDSQLVGPPLAASASVSAAATSLVALGHVDMVDVEVRTAARVVDVSSVKRKRGRPPRIQGKTGPSLPPQRKKMDEEDVCFICFDGGSLVLCDRRGCPKAYHPACIKRDEAFFRSKAKWNCGWHICSSCQKASHYMCYTCTFSLCKGCTKGADYVCVRGTKGFCGTCMRTIMLIENITLGNTEKVQVDFDDQTSWEFLFKVYWTYLKAKLSLTIDELTSAKNPWKGDELPKTKNSWKGTGFVTSKEVCTDEPFYANNEKGSSLNNCFGNVEANHFKRRKTEDQSDQLDQSKLLIEKNTLVMEESTVDNGTPLPEGTTWATKELLEFVGHMKNGDTSLLSQFDVQALLLEYVKRKNLRDPHQKCQIICDSRLINLFGRPRLGHIEMLKLLENHYLIKEKSQADDAVRATVPDALSSQSEGAGSSDSQLVLVNDRRCRTRKRTNEKESPINPNPDEYAAVDVHNINLLYVKRSLMENLLDDAKNFYEKVVGSFVRIRISSGDQKQEMHRLVQVVGTSKVDESYKVGSRTADVKLEVLNLDKEEVVSIDEISNQNFSVDECRRLRQSIKCGLIKRLKVGEIQEKATVLQPVKVSDCLEAEILRCNHLRDRASEKGHRKELRECVEKLELLKSPEERQRRLLEIHDIHIDPNMDPSYESEEDAGESDDKKQGGVARKGIEGDLNDVGTRALKTLAIASEKVRNMDNTFYVDPEHTIRIQEGVSESAWSQGGGALGLHSQNGSKIQLGGAGAVTVDWKSQAAVRSESLPGVASSVMAPPLSSGNELFIGEFETDKLWHYQDPSRKIQGPFSMMQLRKWSASEIFPHDFRVWRVNEKQDDSILLSDALLGRFHREPLQPRDSYSLPQIVTSNDADKKWEYGLRQSTDLTWIDNKRIDNDQEPVQNDVQVHANIDKSNGLGSHSSTWTKVSDVAISDDAQAQRSLEGWELPEGSKSWAGQSQNCSSLSAPSSSGKPCEAPFLHEREGHGDEKWSLNPGRANEVSNRTTKGQTNVKESDEKRADSEGHSSQSSGQNWRPHSMNSSTSGWDFNSGFVSVAKSIGKTERNKEIDFSNMLSPTAKQSHEDLKVQVAENKLSLSSNVPVQDSGPSWSTASSLVIGGEWVGYSSTPAKPCVEEWDSNLVSASSLKPTEGTSDHVATPTSGTDQLTHSSSTHPTIDASSWQPMVPEPNEFCSLVDESVSDLLAEVEAMESLGGLPSPTSKMRCDGELTPGSDDDCFSPVEPFSPAPDPGKSDALSSTGDIKMPYQLAVAEESLRLSLMLSQPTIADEPLAVSQVPSQLTLINKPPQLAQMPPQGIVPDETVRASQMPSQSTLTEEPLRLWQSNALDSQKSFSGHSSSAEAEGETKRSEVSVNQWETRLEIQPLRLSTVKQGEAGSDIHQAPTPSRVSQWEAGSNNRHPASSTVDACQGTDKGNANLNQGVAPQGNTNMFWGSGHGSIQQQGSTNSVISAGNQGSWGNQPRYGGDNRYSGQRDHRNHFQIRDSGFGRDRSSNRRPSYGGGNGGSYKPPSKGQRVCKFFENGYCKKGASCSYWHP